MNFYFSKKVTNQNFEEAIENVTEALKVEGFGILTLIDVKETFKKKLDVDFKKYIILGACNPSFAHKALLHEDKIGVFLPCNIVIEEHENGEVEVSAVDPAASLSPVKNKNIESIASEIQQKLKSIIESL